MRVKRHEETGWEEHGDETRAGFRRVIVQAVSQMSVQLTALDVGECSGSDGFRQADFAFEVQAESYMAAEQRATKLYTDLEKHAAGAFTIVDFKAVAA